MFRQWCLASQELAAKVVGNLKLGPRSIGLTGLRLPCNAGTAGTARVGGLREIQETCPLPETCLGLATLARDIWKTGAWGCA